MKYLVLGGGISGLYAAWLLLRAGEDVEVWEASSAFGGWAQTCFWPGEDGTLGWLERGPQSLSWRKGSSLDRLLSELGLSFEVAPPKPRGILKQGRIHPMPWGPGWLGSSLLPVSARLRMLLEPFHRRASSEESLQAFIARRLGPVFAREILPALSSGLLGEHPERISAAALPVLARLEAKGGLALGALRQTLFDGPEARVIPRSKDRLGIGLLTETLAARLGDRAIADLRALSIEALPNQRWRVFGDGVQRDVDRVILALPAFEAGRLLAPLAGAAAVMTDLPYKSVRTRHSRHTLVPGWQRGFSVVAAPCDGEGILGASLSAKGDPRVPPGLLQLRIFGEQTANFESAMAWFPGLPPASQSRTESADAAIPNPAPGQMTELRRAAAALPEGLAWIGVPRFGTGIVEAIEQIRRLEFLLKA
ncbi:MAG TPA: FAD-dependent oxidoreductase [Holophaga sp.]|nr:FAD-dependent oxidoreductase [Holophaga sp.]